MLLVSRHVLRELPIPRISRVCEKLIQTMASAEVGQSASSLLNLLDHPIQTKSFSTIHGLGKTLKVCILFRLTTLTSRLLVNQVITFKVVAHAARNQNARAKCVDQSMQLALANRQRAEPLSSSRTIMACGS